MPMNMTHCRRLLSLPFALLLCLVCSAAAAHEGHHDEEAAAPQAQSATATSEAVAAPATPQLEVVARREGGDLVFYVDDYASNAPLDGLQLSLRSGTLSLQAAGGTGVYRIPAELLALPAGQPLELVVHGAGIDARLQLPTPAAAATSAETAPDARHAGWVDAGGVLAIALLAVLGYSLHRRRAGPESRGLGAA